MVVTSSMGITPTTSSAGLMENPIGKVKPTIDVEHPSQRECVSMTTDPLKDRVVSHSSEIIGEGAAIFTDITETMLTTLDQQMAKSFDVQKPEGIPSGKDMTIGQQIGNRQTEETQGKTQITSDPKKHTLTCFYQLQKTTE